MTRFYIASSRDGLGDVIRVFEVLERAGMQNASPWPKHFEHICSSEACGIANRDDLAFNELLAASSCDLFIGIARLGKGSHVELGAALMHGHARIILVGVNGADSVFYDMHRVERAVDVVELFDLLGVSP